MGLTTGVPTIVLVSAGAGMFFSDRRKYSNEVRPPFAWYFCRP